MAQDIFISYSRNDLGQAQLLAELLTSAGLSVWIDQTGIDVSTSWSGEIVDAIDACTALVVLLSPSSVASKNVVREVALAFEKNKKILPLELEPVTLSRDLEYHLAGIQRAPMTNIDSIIRTLGKLGLEATQAPTLKIVKESDARKSLMILPFQDLSPTGDNGWFADGIVSELIQALSNVKALHVTDAQTTKNFKRYQGTLPTYAKEMQVRYFVEGDVRKFGDQIKVNSRLLDIETGDHLWQDSLKGTMNDIFDIQEKVAEKVVEGLKVHLASDEKLKLSAHGTENAEAYEYYMKAIEYFHRNTREGFNLAIQLFTQATQLDPSYAWAYYYKANALVSISRLYGSTPVLLDEAERLCAEALRLKPDMRSAFGPLSQIYQLRGKLAEAEEAAREMIRRSPTDFFGHFTLGMFYSSTGDHAKAAAAYEQAARLKPTDLPSLWNLVANLDEAGEREKCARWADVALPLLERHLKLRPDDETWQVGYALMLMLSGRTEALNAVLTTLTTLTDGVPLYNASDIFRKLGRKAEALATLRKSIEAGFKSIRHLKDSLQVDDGGLLSLADTPGYEEVKRMVEELEVASKANG